MKEKCWNLYIYLWFWTLIVNVFTTSNVVLPYIFFYLLSKTHSKQQVLTDILLCCPLPYWQSYDFNLLHQLQFIQPLKTSDLVNMGLFRMVAIVYKYVLTFLSKILITASWKNWCKWWLPSTMKALLQFYQWYIYIKLTVFQ